MKKRVREYVVSSLGWVLRALRPLLGPPYVCLYPVNCIVYTESLLLSLPWYKAIPKIIVRILSCNPVVGYIRRKYSR